MSVTTTPLCLGCLEVSQIATERSPSGDLIWIRCFTCGVTSFVAVPKREAPCSGSVSASLSSISLRR